MENCKLPRDLLIEILARLSVKSLMRFKCVCTYFYDLIKNDHLFMHKHYEFSRVKNHCALLQFCSADFPVHDHLYNLLYKESECSETRCVYLDMPNSKIRYVKCCDGMLCLIVGKGYSSTIGCNTTEMILPDMVFDVFALNPSTREIKALPAIKVPNKPPNQPPIQSVIRIGFGFGVSNNMAWKVIMFVSFEHTELRREDGYEVVMVCSQVGDSWKWRQIDAVPHCPRYFPYLNYTVDFHLKGKYYWHCLTGHLIWFDMDDEVFGKIEIPFEFTTNFVTVMNETIALISHSNVFMGDEGFIDIWLMDANNNNITWRKQPSIHFRYSINHYWTPIGIWNLGGQLLVFSGDMELRYNEIAQMDMSFFKDGSGPDLFSIDLVTQEKKIICTNQVKKSAIKIGLNPAGNVQIFSERNINKAQEWNDSNIAWYYNGPKPYARVFHESLKFF